MGMNLKQVTVGLQGRFLVTKLLHQQPKPLDCLVVRGIERQGVAKAFK